MSEKSNSNPELTRGAAYSEARACMTRLAVVDKQQTLTGYELRFSDTESRACAAFLEAMVTEDPWPLGSGVSFVPLTRAWLEGGVPATLPSERIAFVVAPGQFVAADDVMRVLDMRKAGFQFCLDGADESTESHPLADIASYVRMDWRSLGPRLAEVSWKLRSRPVKQVVARVRHKTEFAACCKVGVDLVQGDFYTRPGTLKAKGIAPAHANIVTLMSLVRENADMKRIDEVLKRDASISYKLLRYINSAAFGLSCEVNSFRHAVTILGFEKLLNWLGVLLVNAGADSTPQALSKAAVTRGQFATLLGKHCVPGKHADDLFIVGLFSLLDSMMEMRMDTILEHIKLPPAVRAALLAREGTYGRVLDLVEACEGSDFDRSAAIAAELLVEPGAVNQAHLEAISWVERLPL